MYLIILIQQLLHGYISNLDDGTTNHILAVRYAAVVHRSQVSAFIPASRDRVFFVSKAWGEIRAWDGENGLLRGFNYPCKDACSPVRGKRFLAVRYAAVVHRSQVSAFIPASRDRVFFVSKTKGVAQAWGEIRAWDGENGLLRGFNYPCKDACSPVPTRFT
jgi:hypothetical protein